MRAKIWFPAARLELEVPPGHAREVVERLCRGGTSLRDEARRLNIPHYRTELRKALALVLGSEEVLARLLRETEPNSNPDAGRRAITRYGLSERRGEESE